MENAKIGLLPLYAGLYDRTDPGAKYGYDGFIGEISSLFESRGVRVLRSPVGIYESDIKESVESFEKAEVSAIVVLFLAYHPSLESSPALSATKLPVAILDTTASPAFGPDADPGLILSCHGIHGVQDLCCVLQRLGKPYRVFAGHYKESDAIERCAGFAKAAAMARAFKNSRVGIIGKPFEKMGDFAIPFELMESSAGIKTVPLDTTNAASLAGSLTAAETDKCEADIKSVFSTEDGLDEKYIKTAARCGALIRKWISRENLNAFTFNFLDFRNDLGLPTIPFAAASLLMGEGVGYAGEGDVLTAALVAAALRVYPDSTFTEMFCPDWRGGTIFMSHMGEVNYKSSANARIFKKSVPYVPEVNGGEVPGVSALYKKGAAALVNLVPTAGGAYRLILAPCEIRGTDNGDNFQDYVRGWLRPPVGINEFLEEYSRLGGTHHSCLCYGADVGVLKMFGEIMGWEVNIIDA